MTLILCPAPALAEVCASRRPSHVMRFSAPGAVPDLPVPAETARLDLAFNDIAAPRPGLVAPDAFDIAAILAFGEGWDPGRPMVVSCLAGVSRSTAAVFILLCARNPDLPEADIARELRHAAPCATPNPLMVALADDLLARDGRMSEAIHAIGRGADYEAYRSIDVVVG